MFTRGVADEFTQSLVDAEHGPQFLLNHGGAVGAQGGGAPATLFDLDVPVDRFAGPAARVQLRQFQGRGRLGPELPSPTHYLGVAGLGEDAPLLPLTDPRAGFFGYDRKVSTLDFPVSPRGYRVLGRIPRLPKLVVQRIIQEFGGLEEVLAASDEDLEAVEGVAASWTAKNRFRFSSASKKSSKTRCR